MGNVVFFLMGKIKMFHYLKLSTTKFALLNLIYYCTCLFYFVLSAHVDLFHLEVSRTNFDPMPGPALNYDFTAS